MLYTSSSVTWSVREGDDDVCVGLDVKLELLPTFNRPIFLASCYEIHI